ncbi:hypothetical protein TNCV_1022371 [Trichonephila clavipes]|nr:hypothetical protein TNCV_1022371 [Trichonephila clavipes]
MVGGVLKTLEETYLHNHNHLSCHCLQRNMDRFTKFKLADMHLIYGLEEGNARAAERLYRERYPQREALERWMFTNSHRNLCEYGLLLVNRHRE